MEYNYILAGAVWAIIGGLVVFFYMKNKTSTNPHSYKDEIEQIKKDIEDRFRSLQNRSIPTVSSPAPGVTISSAPVQGETKVEIAAEAVTVLNNRAEDATSTTAGAKTGDYNDEILGLDKKD